MSILESTVNNIDSLDKTSIEQAKKRLDRLIKPQGSLGKMEDICMQLAGIHKSKYFDTSKKVVIAFGADHGVYEEGVAPDPQSITYMQLPNFTKGICGVGVISKFVGADVVAVDIGVNCDHELEGVLNYKIRKGTSNMAKGPAMTREEAIRCLEIGIEMAEDSIKKGYNLIGIGEMGICNTTPSSAIISVIDNCDPEDVTGIGAGLKKERVKFKADTIRKSIELNKPNPEDAPSDLAIIGRYLLTPEIFGILETQKPGAGDEVQLTDAIDTLNKTQRVFAREFTGDRYDVGDKFGFMKTSIDYALKHPQVKDDLKQYLIDLGHKLEGKTAKKD